MKSKHRSRNARYGNRTFSPQPSLLSLAIRGALRRQLSLTSALTLGAMLSTGMSDKALAREAQVPSLSAPVEQTSVLETGLLVIDSSVPNYRQLLSGLRPGFRAVVLDPGRDGLTQLNELLKAHRGVRSVHLLAHGEPGALRLGNAWVRREDLEAHRAGLSGWFRPGPVTPELIVYGCDVAAGAKGEAFVARLAALTGADVAASDDVTGARSRGGDWVLEHKSGTIDSALAFSPNTLAAYPGILATITVNTTNDVVDFTGAQAIGNLPGPDGNISLREAVIAANNTSGADTIVLGTKTYKLTRAGIGEDAAATGDLDITSDITIRGAGQTQTVIDANRLDRVLHVLRGASLTLEDATVTGGTATGSSFPDNSGGGIFNWSKATIENSAVSGNNAPRGGGISSVFTLTLTSSTIASNTATSDGGAVDSFGAATITNSTMSGNRADERGGGIFNADGVVDLINSTVSGNSAMEGGGIYNGDYGTATISNSTVWGNNATTGGGIFDRLETKGEATLINSLVTNSTGNNCAGPIVDGNFNLADDASCGPNLYSSTINLGSLAFNGGSTKTHALLVGSSAIDAVTGCVNSLATDQRGVSRPQGASCDIGAYEDNDADDDGIEDSFEIRFGLNPNVDDAAEDPDGDGKTNLEEFLNQTHPLINEPAIITIINSILLDD